MNRQHASRGFSPLLTTATVFLVSVIGASAGCDSREEEMNRAIQDKAGVRKEKEKIPEPGPSDPLRDQLAPVLTKIYPLNEVPRVVQADIDMSGRYKYQVDAGVAAVVRFASGLDKQAQVEAVLLGVAEADAWAFRPKARRDYAELIHKVGAGYGADQKAAILKAYAHLRLLQFFNDGEAQAAINALPADLKPHVVKLQKFYTSSKEQVWEDWMAVKMYARRTVSGDEPFRGVLRGIKKELGKEEPPPRTWEQSHSPTFARWAEQIRGNEELLIKLTSLDDLQKREEYLNDTHTLWVVQGSSDVPAKAKSVKINKGMGFGVHHEDLGGGYNELTFVFSNKLKGAKLKKAYLRSIIYGQLLSDFQLLATAGSDFAKRTADNMIDSTTSVVPDEYDPLYAACGSGAALDTFIVHYKDKFALLSDLKGNKNESKILDTAHKCVIEGARGKIHIPDPKDEKDVEGPAPGTRLGLFQMLARFESSNVDLAKMSGDKRTAEDDDADAALAELKELEALEGKK